MNREHITFSRRIAREGAVLLKNDGVLPLKEKRIVMLGKGTVDYVKGGGGSGDVSVAYTINMLEGMKEMGYEIYEPIADYYEKYVEGEYSKGIVPGLIREPELDETLLEGARAFSDTAVLTFSRFSGENWDRATAGTTLYSTEEGTMELLQRQASVFEKGDYYLSAAEEELLEKTLSVFPRVVIVLNAGGIMDTSFIKDDERVDAALHAFQGGEEGGLAVAELLSGKHSPSGKLTDTYARSLEDYPSTEGFHKDLEKVEYTEDIYVGYRYFSTIPYAEDRVLYPFGYGLSYTRFTLKCLDIVPVGDGWEAEVLVKNIGYRSSREVVEFYVTIPKGRLDAPLRVLVGFAKTRELESGEEETVKIAFSRKDFASFDDEGVILKSSWVLEKGNYELLASDDGINFSFFMKPLFLERDETLETVRDVLAPKTLSKRLRSNGRYEELEVKDENRVESGIGRQDIRTLEFPSPIPRYYEKRDGEMTWSDVRTDEDVEKLAEYLTDEELIDIVSGQPNRGYANTFGFGNVTNHEIPSMMTADGPAGIRFEPKTGVTTTGWPCATLLASTWDTELAYKEGAYGALEAKENDIASWLTPAVNIHRSPLCGRNFEYYSEDPLLTGKMAASFVRGVQSEGVSACVKHFAANNKETNRKDSNSVVSQRALREIYLRQFEIIIKEADPWMLMSAYNWLNGIRTSENRELLSDVLRGDWKWDGMVVSDWWNHGEQYLELLAGNDLKMALGYPERVKEALDKGLIGREDVKKCAVRVMKTILKTAR